MKHFSSFITGFNLKNEPFKENIMSNNTEIRRILFKCKGNICRSVAAQYILLSYRPNWIVQSCATTPHTRGLKIDERTVRALEEYNFPVPDKHRNVLNQDEIIEEMPFFDEIHDLSAEGLEDPYITGAFNKSILEIEEYIHHYILNKEE